MQRSEVLEQLKAYIGHHVLDDKDIGLDEATPLLEWGVINSLELMKLVSFIQNRFGIEVPGDRLIADYFTNLTSITDLVQEIARGHF